MRVPGGGGKVLGGGVQERRGAGTGRAVYKECSHST